MYYLNAQPLNTVRDGLHQTILYLKPYITTVTEHYLINPSNLITTIRDYLFINKPQLERIQYRVDGLVIKKRQDNYWGHQN